MATDPNEVGGWVVDPANPNRATYTDPDGNVFEAVNDTPAPAAPDKNSGLGIKDIVAGRTTPERGAGERIVDSYKDATNYGFPGLVARTWYDWSDKYKPELKKQFPGKPEEWYEEKMDEVIGKAQGTLRSEAEARQAADPNWKPDESFLSAATQIDKWGPWFAGQVLGSAGPESLLNPGGTAGARVLGQGLIGGVSDIAYQTKDVLDKVAEEFQVEQTLTSVATSMGLQGTFEIPGFVRNLFAKRGVDTTPGAMPEAVALGEGGRLDLQDLPGDRISDTVTVGDEASQLERQLAEEANAFIGKKDAVEATNPAGYAPEQSLDDQLTAVRAKVAAAPTVTVPTGKPKMKVDEAVSRINELTSTWENAPEFEVIDDIANHPNKELAASIDPAAIGVMTPEGKIIINMKNVANPEVLSAVTFHEGLGHHGLQQQFRDELDYILDQFYTNSKGDFSSRVDEWLEANPDEYDGSHIRAAEEVLAEMSEMGQIDRGIVDQLKDWLKMKAREMGLDLKFSDREIRSILAMSHRAVVDGKGTDVAGNGFKYAKVYHGSPYDFDEFDHSKMGSGEGAQVYGWGTYLTDTKEVAEGYRDRLSGRRGSKDPQEPINGSIDDHWTHSGKDIDDALTKHEVPYKEWGFVKNALTYRNAKDRLNARIDELIEKGYDNRDKMNYWSQQATKYEEIDDTRLIDAARRKSADLRKAVEETTKTYEALDDFRSALNPKNPDAGKLFEVDIPDENWLLWDKSIKDQDNLIDVLKDEGFKVVSGDEYNRLNQRYKDLLEDWYQARQEGYALEVGTPEEKAAFAKAQRLGDESLAAKRELGDALSSDWSGEAFYRWLSRKDGGDKQAAEYLKQIGVVGNKYLDGFSRDKGDGSYNYVVFDEGNAKITNKYMKKRKDEGDTPDGEEPEERPANVGAINPNKINTITDIDDYLYELEAVNPKSEAKSWEDTEAEALARGLTPSRIAKRRGAEGLSSYLRAANIALAQQLENVAKAEHKLSTEGYSVQAHEAALKAMSMLKAVHARVNHDNSEVGRALNILKRASASKEYSKGLLATFEGLDNDILTDPDQFMKYMKLLSQQMQMGNTNGAIRLTSDVFKKNAENYVFRAWYNMLLSALGTHVANFFGTGGNFVVDLMETTGAAAMGQGKRFSNQERIRGREVAYRVYGVLAGLKAGTTWSNARQSLNTGLTGNMTNSKASTNVYTGDNKLLGAASGFLESPTRALAGSDEWWRGVMGTSNLYGLAVRNAGNKGLKGKAFWDEVNDLIANPTKEMIDATNDYTKVLQFLDKPSRIAQTIINAQTPKADDALWQRGGRFGLKMGVPFVSTPDSLIRTAIRRSVVLSPFERENVKGWKAGGAERDKVKARLIMGSYLSFYIATQVAAGNITGEGPQDYKKKAEWLGTHQANSIKVGDKWYSIAGLEPVSTNITAIATLGERFKSGEISHDDYARSATALTQGVGAALVQNSYLEGFQNLTEMASDDPRKAEHAVEAFIANIASSATTPAVLRAYAQADDPTIRDTTGDGSFEDRLAGRIKSGVPGLTGELPQKYDVYGRPMSRVKAGPDAASRTFVKEDETDPAIVEMGRLGELTDKVIVGQPGKNVKVEGVERRLNAEEFQAYQYLSGYWITETVRAEMETPEWEAMSDDERIAELKDIVKDMRKEARTTLFNPEGEEDE